jgi:hypothetical protein
MSETRDDERTRKLERLLDNTLRGMVAGEGPADLRARVLARLGGSRPRAFSPAWATAVAAAVLAAGWWFWRPAEPVPGPAPRFAGETPRATASAPPSPEASVPTPPPAPKARVAPAPLEDEPGVPTLPPLPPPEPLAVASLQPKDLEIEPLAFAPIVVADLAIDPLEEPEHERKE